MRMADTRGGESRSSPHEEVVAAKKEKKIASAIKDSFYVVGKAPENLTPKQRENGADPEGQ